MLSAFEGDMVRVYYDADVDCIAQIREKLKDSSAEIHVLPYCIGGTDGKGTLHVNYDTTSSSLYPLNPDYASYYFFLYNHDFVASDSIRTMEKRDVDVVSLDSLYGKEGVGVAMPDFLSMDVQGAEHAILRGATSTLRSGVLGLVIEAGLHPLYQGQRTFGDVQSLLLDAGFHFVRFLGFHDYAPFRTPVGLRGEGFHILTDALFLRRIDAIEQAVSDSGHRRTMLRKLAFISLVYDQPEYALECLQRCGTYEKSGTSSASCRYEMFLDDIERSAAKMSMRFPMLFSEKYTFGLSKRRFASSASFANDAEAAGMIERIWLRFVYPNIYLISSAYDFLVERMWGAVASLILPSSPVERIFKKYGLAAQARLLKKKRVVQALFCKQRQAHASAQIL